jgi:hypothetical protein
MGDEIREVRVYLGEDAQDLLESLDEDVYERLSVVASEVERLYRQLRITNAALLLLDLLFLLLLLLLGWR